MVNNSTNIRNFKINSPIENKRTFNSNAIATARYNAFTFIPLSLVYQFKSQYNVFQLVVIILVAIKEISPFSDYTGGLFALVVILVMGMVREAIEDVKKTKYDIEYNGLKTMCYDSTLKSFHETSWKDLLVGDIIKVNKNEILPADIIVIYSSSVNGICYLQTTNLDGENTLKPRETLTCFKTYTEDEGLIDQINGIIEVDEPNNNIYKIEGTVLLPNDDKKYNFDINQTLIRGGTLKNVNYVYGIIIYTGKDTKLMQNIKNTTTKLSYIEIQLNKMIYYILLIIMIFAGISTGVGLEIQKTMDLQEDGNEIAWYVYPNLDQASDIKYGNYVLQVFQTLVAFFINYCTFLPLALMLLIEILKPIQLAFIAFDDQMLSEGEDFKVMSMKLQENLGAVKYIFSDKTGTLTKNEMHFHSCSIFGKIYEPDLVGNAEKSDKSDNKNKVVITTTKNSKSNVHNVNIFSQIEDPNGETYGYNDSYNNGYINGHTKGEPLNDKLKDSHEPKLNDNITAEITKSLFTNTGVRDLLLKSLNNKSPTHIEDEENPFNSVSSVATEFLIGISLNHNVYPEIDEQTQKIVYTGPNPDEVALISTIKELGMEYVEKSGNFITVKVNGIPIIYEILFQFDFTPERKRSSIIVKDPDGLIKIYMKGADDVVLEKINDFSEVQVKTESKMHLEKFGKHGLRTLCYTVKPISQDDFTIWLKTYEEYKYKSLTDKSFDAEISNLITNIEEKSILLGVTGLEDQLQDEVNDVIDDLLNAGISVWMITGDKLDTAESIGFSCKLINDDTEVFKIRAGNKEKVLEDLKTTLIEMEKLEVELMNFKIQKSGGDMVREIFVEEHERLDRIRKNTEIVYNQDIDLLNKGIKAEDINNFRINDDKNGSPIKPDDLKYNTEEQDAEQDKNQNQMISISKHEQKNEDKDNQDSVSKIKSQKNEDIKDVYYALNVFNKENDIAILKFIMEQKKEEQIKTNLPTDKVNETVSVFEEIINDATNDKKSVNIDGNNDTNKVLFEINQGYNNYQTRIKDIEERKKGLLNKMEIVDEKHKYEKELTTKTNLLINFSLLIEGEAITHFVDPDLQEYAWKLVQKCRSLICCRCNPLQKSSIVKFVKKNTNDIVLAIGDGGNDVNMIKEAHVGIGLFGKEGNMAAFNSDYAISQFKYLRRLLFYHGRQFILRNSYFILFYLYKNLLITIPQFCLAFVSGFSGTNLFEYWFFLGYNVIFTIVPHSMYMLYDEDIDIDLEDFPESAKKLIPELYKETRDSDPFSVQRYLITTSLGAVQSVVFFFFPYIAFKLNNADQTGLVQGFWDISLSVFNSVLLVQFIILQDDSKYWNKNVLIGWIVQYVSLVIFYVWFEYFYIIEIRYEIFSVFRSLNFWLTQALTVVVSVFFVSIFQRINILCYDNIVNNLRLQKYDLDNSKHKLIKKIEKMSEISRNLSKFKKILKEENFKPDNYSDKRIKVWVDKYKDSAWEKNQKQMRQSIARKSQEENFNTNFNTETINKNIEMNVQKINNTEYNQNPTNYNYVNTEVIKIVESSDKQ